MKNILVFYEGESELNYINKLKQLLKISKKKISIKLKKETISLKLINIAFSELRKNDYDFVFIICDREEDQNRIKTLNDCEKEFEKKNKKNSKNVKILVSNLCFEVWLLFHFKKFYCKNFTMLQLKNELQKFNYKKADIDWIDKFITEENLKVAIENSDFNNEMIKAENQSSYYYSETSFQHFAKFLIDNR